MSWFREKQENVLFWIEYVIKMLVGIFVFEKNLLSLPLCFNDEDEKVLHHIRFSDLKQKKTKPNRVQELA